MSEAIIMADMSAAVSLSGLVQAVGTDVPDMKFGDVMGALMSVQNVPAELTEEIIPDVGLADMLFSDEGLGAFLKTLELFVSEDDFSSENLAALWENISTEEKSAFAEMLDSLKETPENEEIPSPSQLIAKIVSQILGNRKKPENDSYIMAEAAAATMFTVRIISDEASEVPVQENNVGVQNTNVQNVDVPENIQNVLQNVYEALEEKTPEEFEGFIDTLARELRAEISASENPTENDAADVEMFAGTRQAVMARAARPLDEAMADDAVTQAAVETAPSDETAALPVFTAEADDIPVMAQNIIERIEEIRASSVYGSGEINMKLSPDELGEIRIRIKSDEDGIKIAFSAEKSEAAALIGDRVNALAEALAARGTNVKEISVTRQVDSSQNSSDNALEYSGMQGGNESRPNGEGRRFTFSHGTMTENVISDDETQDSEIYFNKEVGLWVSA
ncbi:MAG: flagellar hook-length control protein FliK [Huintestinicola sp.]